MNPNDQNPNSEKKPTFNAAELVLIPETGNRLSETVLPYLPELQEQLY